MSFEQAAIIEPTKKTIRQQRAVLEDIYSLFQKKRKKQCQVNKCWFITSGIGENKTQWAALSSIQQHKSVQRYTFSLINDNTFEVHLSVRAEKISTRK